MRGAEAFDPCGLVQSSARPPALAWGGSSSTLPSVALSDPAGRVGRGRGLLGGQAPREGTRFCPGRALIPRRPFRTRDMLSPQKRAGSRPPLDSISYSPKQR